MASSIEGRDVPQRLLDQASQEISDACSNEFVLLNQRVSFENRVDWNSANLSQLQRYHLHYFDIVWRATLVRHAGRPQEASSVLRGLIESWVQSNQLLQGDGWHPYTVSLRVVNWIHAASVFSDELGNADFQQLFLGSLYSQCRFLSNDLEFDVRGNHLIKNLKAMVFAGVFFAGNEASGWLRTGITVLEREVKEQVLPDGGHFERAPSYHVDVLRDLLEVAVVLGRNSVQVPVFLTDAIRRMARYLANIVLSGGRLPLLKDTAWDACLPVAEVLQAVSIYFDEPASPELPEGGWYSTMVFGKSQNERHASGNDASLEPRSTFLQNSGLIVLRGASGESAVFDVGKPCPDYLPAHAHADLLSFELTIRDHPVIVDSGVFDYDGPWRSFFRSTRAHNTVEVSGQDQSEVWGRFRVGRRARPQDVFYENAGGVILASAAHDGYRRLKSRATHRRTLLFAPGEFFAVLDEVAGIGAYGIDSHFHLHPDIAIEKTAQDAFSLRTRTGNSLATLCLFGYDSCRLVAGKAGGKPQGWYSERFRQRVPNAVLSLALSVHGCAWFGCVFASTSGITSSFTLAHDGAALLISHGDVQYDLSQFLHHRPRLKINEHRVLQPLLCT